MKKYFLLLTVAAMFAASCTSNKATSTVAPDAPSGTFTGSYLRLHINKARTGYDSLKATATIVITASPGYTYKVTGDTTYLAQSKGHYAYNTAYMLFTDSTYTTSVSSAGLTVKPHLVGQYAYAYDGTILQLLQVYPSDTLVYQYNLKKQ